MQNSSNTHVPNMMVETNCLDVGPHFLGIHFQVQGQPKTCRIFKPSHNGVAIHSLSSSSSLQVWWGQRIKKILSHLQDTPKMAMELHCLKDGSRFWGIGIQGEAQHSTCRIFKPNDYTFTSSGVNLKLNPKNRRNRTKNTESKLLLPWPSTNFLRAWQEICSGLKTTQIYTQTPAALSNSQLTRWGLQASVELTTTAYNYSRNPSLGRSRSPNGAMANWDAIPRPNHKCTHDRWWQGLSLKNSSQLRFPKKNLQNSNPTQQPHHRKNPINLSSPKNCSLWRLPQDHLPILYKIQVGELREGEDDGMSGEMAMAMDASKWNWCGMCTSGRCEIVNAKWVL